MSTTYMHRCVRSLACAAGLLALGIAGVGCSSEEQAAVGTIEMGKADKNNLMSFGGGGEAGGGAAADSGGGGRGRGRGKADSGGMVKSIKGGGGGAAP
jgi:hypothetical protein